MLKDYVLYAIKNITKRRMRSWLTMIGIFIGIAAVVSLVSLGQGLQKAIQDQFQSLGTDKIIVSPKGSSFGGLGTTPTKLTEQDLNKIRQINNVKVVTGMLYPVAKIEYKDKQAFFLINAIPDDYEEQKLIKELQTYKIESGRDLRRGEKGKVVLGYSYKYDKIFDKNLRLGETVTINGADFQIVGFAEKIGSPVDDGNIYMSKEEVKTLFNLKEEYDMVLVRVALEVEPKSIVPEIERELRRSRDVKEGQEDFEVKTFDEILQSFLIIFNIVQAVVIGIAAISLLVGAIGIMNTMYTAVLERTKEIGIMKAIGAKNSDIMTIFVIEAGILGFTGGIIGILIGSGISKLVEIIGGAALGSTLLKAYFPAWLILFLILLIFILVFIFVLVFFVILFRRRFFE